MLRLVKPEGPKKPRQPRRPFTSDLLSADEHKRAIQALRNLRDAFGSWGCLAKAMGIPVNAIQLAMRRGRITVAMLYAASKASGLSIDDLLSAPVPADRCRACGQIKRAS